MIMMFSDYPVLMVTNVSLCDSPFLFCSLSNDLFVLLRDRFVNGTERLSKEKKLTFDQ